LKSDKVIGKVTDSCDASPSSISEYRHSRRRSSGIRGFVPLPVPAYTREACFRVPGRGSAGSTGGEYESACAARREFDPYAPLQNAASPDAVPFRSSSVLPVAPVLISCCSPRVGSPRLFSGEPL